MSEDILQTLLSTLTKEQKESLVAKLITDVGGLQPEAHRKVVDKPVSLNKEPTGGEFSTDWGKESGSGKVPVRAKANTWTDTGEARDPDFKPEELVPSPRSARPRTSKVTKTCSVCKKEFEISSSLVYGSFIRCDRCTG